LSPDRWMLWLGVLFVLSVYYFPTGVTGRLRAHALQKKASVICPQSQRPLA
jgi:branched-chain amino acid transport system permease protein